jgi:hypothetical protein
MGVMRRRNPRDVLARARIICLVCSLADGMEVYSQWLADLGLEPHLTPEERLWFFGDEPIPSPGRPRRTSC